MFSTMHTLMILVPGLPLVATLLTALLGPRLLKHRSHWPVVIALGGAFLCSMLLLQLVHHESQNSEGVGWETTVDLWTWIDVQNAIAAPPAAQALERPAGAGDPGALGGALPFNVAVTLRADALTAIMLAMVTFVSTLVAIYSIGYMHGDRGYWRFFTYIGLFVFSMTMLVSVSNFVLLYVFWEAVGVCSYLLIGFWYERPEAAAAGKKAFLVNRVGDFGVALSLLLIWITYGTLNFHDAEALAGIFGQTRLADPSLYVGGATATAICLLLMLGACGKSAQFPLHVWLPDAMEGPTPVSALIHAATMVTAGVYMVTRCTPLFLAAPTETLFGFELSALNVVAVIGAFTAILAGIIALTQNDLKRVLAYSTISQLGYMFLSLGTGTLAGIIAGMFHLFTHAFFKALLFLGAGSVMHAMGGVIDMRRFGGLRRLLPVTHWTFLIGCLALAGVFPFAGFWSKDAILAAVHDAAQGHPLYQGLYVVAVIAALLTSIYTFRALFLTFYNTQRVPPEAGHHAHESPPSMTIPLVVLSVFAFGVGAYFEYTHGFAEFLRSTPSLSLATLTTEELHEGVHIEIAVVGMLAALSGIAVAAFLYLGSPRRVEMLTDVLRPLYTLSYHRLFIDQLYQAFVVWPLWLLARLCYWIDRTVIDGLVNLAGNIPPTLGRLMRSMQLGLVQFYALAMVLGLLVLMATLILWPST